MTVPAKMRKGSPVGLVLPEGMSFEQWRDVGVRLVRTQNAASWGLADWLFYGEWAFGRKYEEALEVTGLAYSTLTNLRFLAGRFEISRRREHLSPAHHAEVASLPHADQDRWLDAAEAHGLTVKALRVEVAATRQHRVVTAPSSKVDRLPTERDEPAAELVEGEVVGELMSMLTFSAPAADVANWEGEASRRGSGLEDWIVRTLNNDCSRSAVV